LNGLAYDPAVPDPAALLNGHWTELRVGFCHPSALGRFAAGSVPALLSDLRQSGDLRAAFFVRKSPGLRLRLCWADRPDHDPVLSALQLEAMVAPDVFLSPVKAPVYREVELFGGADGAAAVEGFFTADSAFILSLAASQTTGIDPLAVSFSILDHLFRAAAQDGWELWAMWHRLAGMRGGAGTGHLAPPAPPPDTDDQRYVEAAATSCACSLRDLALGGRLDQPLRSVLPVVAAFHLNRMGFDAAVQAALAAGAAAALSPHRYNPDPPDLAPIAFERLALGPVSIFDHVPLDAAIAAGAGDPSRLNAAESDVEAGILRLADTPPHRSALVGKSDRPMMGLSALLSLPPAGRRKRHRRDLDTIFNLVWRYAGRPTPCGDLAATRIFDPTDPLQPTRIDCPACKAEDSVFSQDRFDPRPGAALSPAVLAAVSASALAFSTADAPAPSPDQRALAAVLDHLGQGETLRLDDAAVRLSALAEALSLPQQAAALPRLLLESIGDRIDDWPIYPGEDGVGPLSFCPPLSAAPCGKPRRVALLVQQDGDSVALEHLGADRMSWLARYLPRGNTASIRALRGKAAAWIARWPETVDATSQHSTHPLDAHSPLTRGGARLTVDASFLTRAPNGLYELTDANGLPLHAVHFGVSTIGSLSICAQLALLAGARAPSFGEWAVAVANRRIARHLASAQDWPTLLPQSDLAGALVLTGPMLALPATLPAIQNAATDAAWPLWQALTDAGMSPGPMMVSDGGSPGYRVLDLRLSSGLRTLARMSKRGPGGWIFLRPLRRLTDGTLAPEHYIELAASSSDRT
jgi:thiopeptide-type bacteriocin biosynthesis protein